MQNEFDINRKVVLLATIPVFILILIWFASGIHIAGFSIFEDYELMEFSKRVNDHGFWQTLKAQWKYEIPARYRVSYIFYRICSASLSNGDPNPVRWFLMIVYLLNSILLFRLGRSVGLNAVFASLLSVIILVGSQIQSMWRIASGEALALFSWSLASLSLLYFIKRRKKWSVLTFVTFSILAFTFKESFLFAWLIFPILLFAQQLNGKKGSFPSLELRTLAITLVITFVVGASLKWIISWEDAMLYAGSSFSMQDALAQVCGTAVGEPFSFNNLLQNALLLNSDIGIIFWASIITGVLLFISSKTVGDKTTIASLLGVSILLILLHKLLHLRMVVYGIYNFPVMMAFGILLVTFLQNLVRNGNHLFAYPGIFMALVIAGVQTSKAYRFSRQFGTEKQTTHKIIHALQQITAGGKSIYLFGERSTHLEPLATVRYRIPEEVDVLIAGCDEPAQKVLKTTRLTDPAIIDLQRTQFRLTFSGNLTRLSLNEYYGQRKGALLVFDTECQEALAFMQEHKARQSFIAPGYYKAYLFSVGY